MGIFVNIMKKTVTRIILAVVIILIAVSVFLFPNWYEKQYKKLWGYYYVYKGDKAELKGYTFSTEPYRDMEDYKKYQATG